MTELSFSDAIHQPLCTNMGDLFDLNKTTNVQKTPIYHQSNTSTSFDNIYTTSPCTSQSLIGNIIMLILIIIHHYH